MTTKERLHALVDALPEEEHDTAEHVLEALRLRSDLPAVLRDAPLDDEELSEEEKKALDDAEEDVRAGRVRPLEDVKTELGL